MRHLGHFLGILFSVFCLLWLAIKLYRLWHQPESLLMPEALRAGLKYFFVALLLLPFNIVAEALKWQSAMHRIRPTGLAASVADVLRGMSAGFVTPHAVGDYVGRTGQLTVKQRWMALPAVFLCRWSQFFITLLAGMAAWYVLPYHIPVPRVYFWWLWPVLALAAALLAYFLYRRPGRFRRPLRRMAAGISRLSAGVGARVVVFAWLRYVTFFVQYLMILKMFLPDVSLGLLAMGVAPMFLLKSIVPSYNFFSDLGIREWAAVSVFSLAAGYPEAPVIAASLTVWCINTALPVAAGAIGWWRKLRLTKLNAHRHEQ